MRSLRVPIALASVLLLPLLVLQAGAQGGTDADGDSFNSTATGGDDCDDGNRRRYPGATEICDTAGLDEDCNPRTFGHRDSDGDRWVDARCFNVDPAGRRFAGSDCDDSKQGVHPANVDPCDGIDNNCDGTVDESGGAYLLYRDADGDGFGAARPKPACRPETGWSVRAGDCNDRDRAIRPGAGCPTGCR